MKKQEEKEVLKSISRSLFEEFLSEDELDVIELKAEIAAIITRYKGEKGLSYEETANTLEASTEVLDTLFCGEYSNLKVKGEKENE